MTVALVKELIKIFPVTSGEGAVAGLQLRPGRCYQRLQSHKCEIDVASDAAMLERCKMELTFGELRDEAP